MRLFQLIILGLCVSALMTSGCVTTKTLTSEQMVSSESPEGSQSVLDHKFKKYNELAKQFPADPVYQERLAQLFMMEGDHHQALLHIEKAQRIDPENPKYHFIQGRIFRGLGSYKQAEAAFKKVVSLSGSEIPYTGPYFELAYLQLLRNDFAGAEVYLQKCLSLDEEFVPAYYYMGEISKAKRSKDKAIEYFEIYLKKGGTQFSERAISSLYELQPSMDNRRRVIK